MVDVWPCCWRAVKFFGALGPGCWALTPSGRRFGLRPESFREARLAHRITSSEWPAVFDDLAVMEEAVLEMEALRNGR